MRLRAKKLKQLKDYFEKRPEVAMAFLFGSLAKGGATTESDADVAVYFWPEGEQLEWEDECRHFIKEDEIWGDVEKIIGVSTDLVILNQVSSSVAFSAIQGGLPLVIKDRALYLRFFLAISDAAEEMQEYVADFWVIKQRSRSLAKADKERLTRIIDFLESETKDFSKFENLNQRVYEQDNDKRRSVERWAENMVNSSIDIAKILLASDKKRIPQTYRKMLGDLGNLRGFNSKTAAKLSDFAKLRNILAHEYLDIRYKQIRQFIKRAEPLYNELANFTKKAIKK